MASGCAFSTYLPVSREGKDYSPSEQNNEETNHILDLNLSDETEFDTIEQNDSLIDTNNKRNDNIENDFQSESDNLFNESQTVTDIRTKPSLILWLSTFAKVPQRTLTFL